VIRRRPTQNTVEMSLFPFLAVLICALGGLIVLFVVMVLQARTDAETIPLPALSIPPPEVPTVPVALPDYREQMAELLELRKTRLSQLEDARLQLSGIEDHRHKLTQRVRQLRVEIAILEGEMTNVTGSADDAKTQLANLQQQIDEANEELRKVQEEANGRKPTYALVPYEGQSGTRRQPIYIECTADKVVIQPEGIQLVGADFSAPLGPGNPLAAALRTIREYRLGQGIPGQGNPYPLLVVRPGGAESYAAAREALKSWDDEFGYELLDDETELAYPPADRFLAKRLIEVVEIARRRKLALIRAAPGRFGRIEDRLGSDGIPGGGGGENRFVNSGPGGEYADNGSMSSGSSTIRPGEISPTNTRQSPDRPSMGAPSNTANAKEQQQGPELNSPTGNRFQGSADATSGNSGNRDSMNPMAAKRGTNWALPDADTRSSGITRPLRLSCSQSQITLYPEVGVPGSAETLLFDGDPEQATDKLAKLVQKRIKSWGLAGRDFYWRPVLLVTVEPGSETTYARLETLLYGSGIEVKRK